MKIPTDRNIKLNFGHGNVNESEDYCVVSSFSSLKKNYDVLIFTDSKGNTVKNSNNTWTLSLMKYLDNKMLSYLFVSRPKNMTVFFSLINFVGLNNINFHYLITNLGFVDTTPKKAEFIDDIIMQNPFQKDKISKYSLCDYKLNSGEISTLYSISYLQVIEDIAKVIKANFESAYLIGTFEFSSDIKIERIRPFEFFSQLQESNNLIRSICNCSSNLHFVEVNQYLPEDENVLSYDAVHFTQEGHSRMYDICINQIRF